VTLRRVRKRSALPVLAALLVGSATAGAATVLAKPAASEDGATLSANLAAANRQESGPGRPNAARPASPSDEPAATTTTPTTTTPPATSSSAKATTSTTSATPSPPSSTVPPSNPEPPTQGKEADKVVDLVNKARADNGCQPVRVDEKVTAAAVGYSSYMSDNNHFEHTSKEGVTFDQRIKNAGYPLPGAENIARGQKNAQQVMDAWMESSGHRANILNCDLKVIGVGLDLDGFYWTQDFGF
jgi:uncharacterized protein YkwD